MHDASVCTHSRHKTSENINFQYCPDALAVCSRQRLIKLGGNLMCCRLSTVASSHCFEKQKPSHGLNASESHRTHLPLKTRRIPRHACATPNTFTVLLMILYLMSRCSEGPFSSVSLSPKHRGVQFFVAGFAGLSLLQQYLTSYDRDQQTQFHQPYECKSHHDITTILTRGWQKLNKPPK